MLSDHRQQLDGIAKTFCEADVCRADLLDAGDVDLGGVDGESVGQRGKKDRLVRGVPAIHIQCRVSFRIAERLGLSEGGLEGQPGVRHATEDVVGSTVDDAGKRMDAVANE